MSRSKNVALVVVAAAILWWLLHRGDADAGTVGLTDIILTQDADMAALGNTIERAPGTDVEITVVISNTTSGTYRVMLEVFNSSGGQVSAITETVTLSPDQVATTVHGHIIAPQLSAVPADNLYQVKAVLQTLGQDDLWANVTELMLQDALKVVEGGGPGGASGGHIIVYQDVLSNPFDEVFR